MIKLNVQIDLIVFSYLFGMLFNFGMIKLDKFIHNKNKVYSVLNSFTYILFSSLLYFYNIENIANGILHPYSILLIIIGYYSFKPIAKIFNK